MIVITYGDYDDAELEELRAAGRARRHRQPPGRRGTPRLELRRPRGRRPSLTAAAARLEPTELGRSSALRRPPVTAPTPLDLLVLGCGVAGLSAAVRAADTHGMRVGVLTKGELRPGHHPLGPGRRGRRARRRPRLHRPPPGRHARGRRRAVRRRRRAGAGRRGPGRVNELIALGAMFDRDEHGQPRAGPRGRPLLARVVHAGGAATGAEIERALVDAVRRTAAALHEHAFALDLIVEDGRCVGVRRPRRRRRRAARCGPRHVLLATGGAGQLFAVTTNPVEATGDGIAMALRAGVAVADVEFVQFHPTALHHPTMPRPLLSEALRGHGALLRDTDGRALRRRAAAARRGVAGR